MRVPTLILKENQTTDKCWTQKTHIWNPLKFSMDAKNLVYHKAFSIKQDETMFEVFFHPVHFYCNKCTPIKELMALQVITPNWNF